MAEIISAGVHRPRNVDWKRAAALLYGDWGTSKAYVLGLAFVAAGFASFSIILAVCAAHGSRRLQLHHHMRSFSRWRRRVFCCAAAESIFGVGWRASADREFYCNRCVERMGRRNLSRCPDSICAVCSDGSDSRCLEPSTILVQNTAVASQFGWLFRLWLLLWSQSLLARGI